MSNKIISNKFKEKLFAGGIDLDNDTYGAILVNSTSAFSDATIQAFESYSDISAYEIAGTGYSTSGQELSGVAVTSAIGDATTRKLDANNSVWSASTLSADAVVVIDKSTTTPQNTVVCYLPFDDLKVSNQGDFTVVWHTNGIMTLTS